MSLTAPPEVQHRLLDLQALDTTMTQLSRAAEQLPQRAESARVVAELEQSGRLSAQARGLVEDLRTELARVESDVAVVEARISRDNGLVERTSSVKDATGLNSEIASLNRRRAELEDIQLAVMEKLEEAEGEFESAEAGRVSLDVERGRLQESLNDALAGLDAERTTVAASRNALADTLPEDLVALYEKQRARYGFGASLLQRRISSAAGIELTGDTLAAVRAAAPDAVILCPESQAILIRTAESGL